MTRFKIKKTETNHLEFKKFHKISKKLLICAPFFWKKIFLYKKHPVMKIAEKFIYFRSSIVPKILINSEVKIYTGKKWHKRFINKWMVGFKFGEFTWNRRLALFKSKQSKKKKKKNNYEIWTITSNILITWIFIRRKSKKF